MELRHVRPLEVPAVFNLLMENGWERRIADLDEFVALGAASPVAEVAVIDGDVAGFVRGMTDGVSNGYLSMAVVAATKEFFAKLGFGISSIAMERLRTWPAGGRAKCKSTKYSYIFRTVSGLYCRARKLNIPTIKE